MLLTLLMLCRCCHYYADAATFRRHDDDVSLIDGAASLMLPIAFVIFAIIASTRSAAVAAAFFDADALYAIYAMSRFRHV